MKALLKRVLFSLVIGLVVTGLLLGLAFAFDAVGFPTVANALLWQNALLQSSVPLGNVGTSTQPFYEGSPLNILAFLASIPLGFILYSVLAYVALTKMRRFSDG